MLPRGNFTYDCPSSLFLRTSGVCCFTTKPIICWADLACREPSSWIDQGLSNRNFSCFVNAFPSFTKMTPHIVEDSSCISQRPFSSRFCNEQLKSPIRQECRSNQEQLSFTDTLDPALDVLSETTLPGILFNPNHNSGGEVMTVSILQTRVLSLSEVLTNIPGSSASNWCFQNLNSDRSDSRDQDFSHIPNCLLSFAYFEFFHLLFAPLYTHSYKHREGLSVMEGNLLILQSFVLYLFWVIF